MIAYNYLRIGTILALCFAVLGVPSEKESGRVILVSSPKVDGSTVSKIKLSMPTDDPDFAKNIAKTHKSVTEMIAKIDATPAATLKSLPFVNMEKWEKYSAIGCREFLKAKQFSDIDFYKEYMEEMPEVFGALHDLTLSQAVDEYDDRVLEEREAHIVRKVKKYFKIAAEGYMKVPLKIDQVQDKIAEADESDFDAFASANKIFVGYIINDEVNKGLMVDIECYINLKVMETKYILRPVKEVLKFVARNHLNEKESVEKARLWICKSEEGQIGAPFVLVGYTKIFMKDNGEPIEFNWLQTYQQNKRVEITDLYRLKININDRPEPSEEEKKQIKKEKEAKRIKDMKKAQKRKNNITRMMKSRRQSKGDSDSDSGSGSNESDEDNDTDSDG